MTHNHKNKNQNQEPTDLLHADIPDKFKDPKSGAVRVDVLAKSYKELEKKMANQPISPKSPEDYCIECEHHGLFESDVDVNRRMHAKGFTQDQAQEAYDLAAEKMMPMLHEMAADFKADREVEKLINHFGEPSLGRGAGRASSKMDESELSSMMRDPKYWREKDPAFVAKVTQGFENLYGK